MVKKVLGRLSWLVLALSLGVAGCSDDSGDDGGDETGGTGGDQAGAPATGGTGGAGTGGTAVGTGGTGGTATTDAGPPAGPVECGGMTCTEGANLTIIQLGPCCASGIDENGDDLEFVCGAGMAGQGCGQLNTPGEASDECPSESVFGLVTLAGCCRPDGACGIDAMAFGCVARDDSNISLFGLMLDGMSCGDGASDGDGGT